jgi:two-component system chemotaxis response regulator CheB
MKVLVLAEKLECTALLDHLSHIQGEITFIQGRNVADVPRDPAEVDVIMGGEDCSPGSALNSLMLGWRSHPHTYLIPCWFPVDRESLGRTCLWPRLAIDRFDPKCDSTTFSEWVSLVVEWQQNRMHFSDSGILEDRSGLELSTSLCLRRATGVLSLFDNDGGEGELFFRNGDLISASYKHLRGIEVFYEFLCMNSGGYSWEGGRHPSGNEEAHPLSQLIPDGLKLIYDANFLYSFVSNLDKGLLPTDSQSALDDSAAELFIEQKEIYDLIKTGVPVSQIIEASPLSRPSTMTLLAKWFSLEDVVLSNQPSRSECSVLIVDDSRLICRFLDDIFAKDPRVRVAGFAHNGIEALELIGELKPDVVTLDLQMPKMDGITALKHILIRDPRPVVVLSAFTKATSRLTYESFKYGAVDVITKPAKGAKSTGDAMNRELCDRIVQASRVQLAAIKYIRRGKKKESIVSNDPSGTAADVPGKILVVLCGAGGFPTLLKLVFAIPDPKHIPLTVIGVDMPKRVVEALVGNLNKDTAIPVEEISGTGHLRPGVCYIASNEDACILHDDGGQVNIVRNGTHPSPGNFFDELLTSAAAFKSRTVAVLLSGTGDDGLEGVRQVRQNGGEVFALTPGACLRPDLPEKSINIGCAEEIKDIADLSKLFEIGAVRKNLV